MLKCGFLFFLGRFSTEIWASIFLFTIFADCREFVDDGNGTKQSD